MEQKPRTTSRQSGFSAIDLTIALAISGLMLAAAYRAVQDVTPRLRSKQAVNDLASAIRATRAQAILERRTVTMPIDPIRGRYVVTARNAPGTTVREVKPGDPTVRRVSVLPPGLSFSAPFPTSNPISTRDQLGYDPALVFNARGHLVSANFPGYIHLGFKRDKLFWRVAVDRAGNVSTQRWDGRQFK